jgi:glycerophosphoryl diester phosphodiesterase
MWQKVFAIVVSRKQVLTMIHLFYTVLGILIFLPLLGLLGQLMLKLSGNEVLSDMQIAGFIFSPYGFVSFLIIFALSITIIIFEQASMQAVAVAKLKDEYITAISSISFALSHAKKIFFFANRLILRLLIIMLPFLALAGLVAFFFISDHDINYYLTLKPPEFMTVLGINAVILLFMSIVIIKKLLSWSMTLPLILFNDVSPANSFARSVEMTSARKKEIFIYFAKWAVVSMLVGIMVLGTINFIGDSLAANYFDDIKILIFIIGLFAALLSLANIFITIFTSGTFAALIVLLANKYGASLQSESLNVKALSSSWKINKKKIGLAFVGLAIASLIMGSMFLEDSTELRDVEVFAHRGAAGKAPENTMAAFKQAIADKTDWIELDVQESKDGIVMVIHDSDVMKLAGASPKIWESTAEELQKLDIGSWFDPKFAGERIPTLKEVLQEVKGKVKVLIELKYYGHDDALEQKVVDIVEEMGMANDVAVMSLKPAQVEKIKALRPEWESGILLSKVLGDISQMDVDFLAVNLGMMHPSFIKRTHEVGKKLYVWTADDPITVFKMLTYGADGIITNEPEMARKVIEERNDLKPIERLILHTAVILGKELPTKTYRDESP